MKLRIYSSDGPPIQFNNVTRIVRILPDDSEQEVKPLIEPLQFIHDPIEDWNYIDHNNPDTLPPASMKKDFLEVAFVFDPGDDDEYRFKEEALFNGKTFFCYPGKRPMNRKFAYAWRYRQELPPLKLKVNR